MFASINLDGATESAGKQVLTRDGTAAPASHIEIILVITAPDVRCLKADGSFQAGAALQFSAARKAIWTAASRSPPAGCSRFQAPSLGFQPA